MDALDASSAALDERTAASETTESSAANPRKRKKSSRACDFCHVNHQPCDNAQPRCGYCERHGKSCLYLRPQKKRGPAQGYRSALHSMRESAAAWGAALNLIPSLGPVIEGYLQKEEGRRLIRAIKDPRQQEFYIQSWQQSSVFKSFFGDEDAPLDAETADGADAAKGADLVPVSRVPRQLEELPPPPATDAGDAAAAALPPPSPPSTTTANGGGAVGGVSLGIHPMQMPLALPPALPPPQAAPPPPPPPSVSPPHQPASLPYDPKLESFLHHHHPFEFAPAQGSAQPMQADSRGDPGAAHASLTDIVARDAARSSDSFSQTLGSLGFAPGETLDDFLAMSYNPDPPPDADDYDPLLGSELDQKAYYELLMGRQFT